MYIIYTYHVVRVLKNDNDSKNHLAALAIRKLCVRW